MKFEEDQSLIEHFRQSIQFPTVSNEDTEKVNWSAFEDLHQYLKKTYPAVYRMFTKTNLGKAGLQFCWKAEHPRQPPLLFMAHQDVVEIGDPSRWKYPPFSAKLADGCIWGRGTVDCKSLLISELEAVEELFANGFRPDYDLYLSFGYSEEVYMKNAPNGAQLLADHLEEQGVKVGCIFDEGGGISKEKNGKLVARIGLGEKAAVNFELYKDSAGGHSSKPGSGTAVGAVAKAIVAIEGNPFPYRLTPLVIKQLQADAAVKEGDVKRIYGDPEQYWDELCDLAKKDNALDAMLHTTIAFTMTSASEQPNVLPSHAATVMSCRILQGDTVQSVQDYFAAFLPEGVRIRHISGKDPAATSLPEGTYYSLTEKVLKKLYGDDIILVPFLCLGATDSRYYARTAENTFRFDGLYRDSRWSEAHQVNEKIPGDLLTTGKQFFKLLMTTY